MDAAWSVKWLHSALQSLEDSLHANATKTLDETATPYKRFTKILQEHAPSLLQGPVAHVVSYCASPTSPAHEFYRPLLAQWQDFRHTLQTQHEQEWKWGLHAVPNYGNEFFQRLTWPVVQDHLQHDAAFVHVSHSAQGFYSLLYEAPTDRNSAVVERRSILQHQATQLQQVTQRIQWETQKACDERITHTEQTLTMRERQRLSHVLAQLHSAIDIETNPVLPAWPHKDYEMDTPEGVTFLNKQVCQTLHQDTKTFMEQVLRTCQTQEDFLQALNQKKQSLTTEVEEHKAAVPDQLTAVLPLAKALLNAGMQVKICDITYRCMAYLQEVVTALANSSCIAVHERHEYKKLQKELLHQYTKTIPAKQQELYQLQADTRALYLQEVHPLMIQALQMDTHKRLLYACTRSYETMMTAKQLQEARTSYDRLSEDEQASWSWWEGWRQQWTRVMDTFCANHTQKIGPVISPGIHHIVEMIRSIKDLEITAEEQLVEEEADIPADKGRWQEFHNLIIIPTQQMAADIQNCCAEPLHQSTTLPTTSHLSTMPLPHSEQLIYEQLLDHEVPLASHLAFTRHATHIAQKLKPVAQEWDEMQALSAVVLPHTTQPLRYYVNLLPEYCAAERWLSHRTVSSQNKRRKIE